MFVTCALLFSFLNLSWTKLTTGLQFLIIQILNFEFIAWKFSLILYIYHHTVDNFLGILFVARWVLPWSNTMYISVNTSSIACIYYILRSQSSHKNNTWNCFKVTYYLCSLNDIANSCRRCYRDSRIIGPVFILRDSASVDRPECLVHFLSITFRNHSNISNIGIYVYMYIKYHIN